MVNIVNQIRAKASLNIVKTRWLIARVEDTKRNLVSLLQEIT